MAANEVVLNGETVYTYSHPRPEVTVDIILFSIQNEQLTTLLIQRRNEPFQGTWALPGGFVHVGEAE